ncbi:M14 family metallopeptidase [Ramlibacter sp.]|uniref:M14 family metallopeptidase n=1 Tax=Ramlibacter sp. TaxID=1917967 RepID=UPI0018336B7D|nr:M14 family metallopeptidase [Ramlibacter sp.]MBA2674641.1 DUF2817 domain-containing protein [Ramlibacter sp.]
MKPATAHPTFSASYAQAREKFLQAAASAGLQVESKPHPLPGRDGEQLAMDVARDGPPDAANLLVLSSACHGVEGYCGSGVQVAALADAEWREHARAHGVAVLYLHALNPYGFSHIRRTTHENVDLNRNFHDFSKPLPANDAYRELHPLLLPAQWPPSDDNTAAIDAYLAARGEAAYQAAVTGGQHEFPEGLFYGGSGPTWSNKAIREVLRAHGRRAARISWIDLHTGLGPAGLGERIYSGKNDAVSVARARKWWDGGGKTPVTSMFDGSSSAAVLTGLMGWCIYEECPQAQYTGIAMEYGTVPVLDTMQALRAEHWLNVHPEAPAEQARQIKQGLMDAFYVDTDAWRAQILAQARESMFQAVNGLAEG